MRTSTLFILALFLSTFTLLGGLSAKNPLPNFCAVIVIWLIYNMLMGPCRRRRAYRRERRRLQDQYMRTYIRYADAPQILGFRVF